MSMIPNPQKQPHVVILGAGASLAAFPHGDKFGRLLPLMNNLPDIVGLNTELKALGVSEQIDNFETLFDRLCSEFPNSSYLTKIKHKIYCYFQRLKLPEQLTLYDQLILSLTEKDLIATFNWDPFLCLAFQRNMHLKKLPSIVFLHGNVFVGTCPQHMTSGFINCCCSKCGRLFTPVNLLYPVGNKDYTKDPFIHDEWRTLQNYLKCAYLITIFGYSAPKTDVSAREIMLGMWKNNITREFGQISIVDIKDKETIEENWDEFFVRQHYDIYKKIQDTYLFRYPRRSCEAFGAATLFNNPLNQDTPPKTTSLKKYQEWIQNRLVV